MSAMIITHTGETDEYSKLTVVLRVGYRE